MRRVDYPVKNRRNDEGYKQVKEEGQDRQATPIYPHPHNLVGV